MPSPTANERIVVVTTSYPAFEGDPAGHFVESEVRELRLQGDEVIVVHPKPDGAFGWPGAPTRIRERPLRLFDAAGWAVRAAHEVWSARPTRVIAHWSLPSAFPIAWSAIKTTRRHVALEIVSHGGDVRLLTQLPDAVRASLVRRLCSRAEVWRFVSEQLRAELLASLEPPEHAALLSVSTIAPGALEVPDIREQARSLRETIAKDRRLYVCAGRLVPSKRVDKIIDYVATSGDARAREARVLVVLGDGPERKHLERLARAWVMDVRFLGMTSRRDTLSWIGAADELVHASRVEGLSTVVREAETLGVPVTILT